jgi:hypothetical protein
MNDTDRAAGPGAVSLADEEGVKRILVGTLFGLWTTINNLTRLRPSKRDRFRVTSGRLAPSRATGSTTR